MFDRCCKITILLSAMLLASCGSGGGGGGTKAAATSAPPNIEPIANAGVDQTVEQGALVNLSGVNSSDPNDDPISYLWSLDESPSGSAASLASSTNVQTSFIADMDGSYRVSLIVNDGALTSKRDHVVISATMGNIRPIADAGNDQQISIAGTVNLDGSDSFDSNLDTISYAWSLLEKPPGSTADINESSSDRPSFYADLPGQYLAQLIVNDGTVDSSPDTVTVTFALENQRPVADAGADQNTTVQNIQLDGSSSSDPENDPLTYSWSLVSRPSGSSASLSDSTLARPTFVADEDGSYVWSLVVDDGIAGESEPDTVAVIYTAPVANIAPVAQAGDDQAVTAVSTILLDGSESYDDDLDVLTYSWSLLEKPSGSAADIANASNAETNFVADLPGSYLIQLIVDDGTVSSDPDTLTVTYTVVNQKPTANAGNDQNVEEGTLVILNGVDSSDPNDDPITYLWTLDERPAGSSSSLSSSSNVQTTFTPDMAGSYTVSLVVNDGSLSSDPDEVVINATVENIEPVANAGSDQQISSEGTVDLDGSASFDNNLDTITYEWVLLEKPSGSLAEIDLPTSEQPSFYADLPGDYLVQLTVNDGTVDSNPDTATITFALENQRPVANAGTDQNTSNPNIQLDGSSSSDPEDDPLTYNWSLVSRPTGSSASLSSSTVVSPTFVADLDGSYVWSLVVDDGVAGESDPDSVTIIYSAPPPNNAPVARAGDDQAVSSASTIQLDGSDSYDDDLDTLSYEWSLLEKPAGSTADISNATSAEASFYADLPGSYRAQLIVNDGEADSNPDTLTVTYSIVNQKPVANAGPDQNTTDSNVQLDGSGSSDPDDDPLTYSWSLVSRPAGSTASLSSASIASPTFTADESGSYVWSLVVDDGIAGESDPDSVSIQYTEPSSGGSFVESFDGAGDISDIDGVVTTNASVLPDVIQTGGRYRALLDDNSGNKTLHYNEDQGRLDAWQTRFPFEFIARNIGIGSVADSQATHEYVRDAFNFAGVQVHALPLSAPNSAHVVVGHRGRDAQYTIEGKNTVNGSSSVNDIGTNVAPDGRADIRIVGDSSGSLTVYWQTPNLNHGSVADSWQLYDGDGKMPGTEADFGSEGSLVYVGLITYAYNTNGIPFVGTCDSVELIER